MLYSLKELQDPNWPKSNINNKWVPCRPLTCPTLIERIKEAWHVFTGKYDSLSWLKLKEWNMDNNKLEPVTQKDLLGCGVACVACILGKSYESTLQLFMNPRNIQTQGCYCEDLVGILNQQGLNYTFKKFVEKDESLLHTIGTIVFIEKNEAAPSGHWLVKTLKGWMTSWINFPHIPIESGFLKELPGKADWIVYQE